MMRIRRSADRGHAMHGWLDSYHTFSFAEYYDPAHMGFGALRVINEDRVQPGQGFGSHSHRDMEIVSYVLAGALAHKDSLGNTSIIRPGEVQRMTAGTGVVHSEFNSSAQERVHFYQIWILPARLGLAPGYEQKPVPPRTNGAVRLVASPDGHDGSVTIHQDATISVATLHAGEAVVHAVDNARRIWVQVARGELTLNGTALHAGDGAALSEESALRLHAGDAGAELLVFDLA